MSILRLKLTLICSVDSLDFLSQISSLVVRLLNLSLVEASTLVIDFKVVLIYIVLGLLSERA